MANTENVAGDRTAQTNPEPMGFYFNQKACIGCRTCQVACKDKNDLEVGMLFRRVSTFEVGAFPAPKTYHLSATCNNCANPACVQVCPVSAMYIDLEDGTTQHDSETCIGCQYCVEACPYGVPQYDEVLQISRKCDSCIGLRANGEQPACVASCVMRALEFGKLSDLIAAHPDAVDSIKVLPDPAKTTPSVRIDARPAALEDGFRQLVM